MSAAALRCADCGHGWVTRDGRTLNVTPSGLHRVRCGRCVLERRRKMTANRVRAHRARCNAHSAATTATSGVETLYGAGIGLSRATR